jgi:hypothetical protein
VVAGTTFTIPIGTYNTSSTIEITGLTSATATANWNRPLGAIVYNCPTQSGNVSFGGNLTDVQSLTVQETNGQQLRLATTQTFTLSVNGDVDISGDSRVFVATTGTGTINVTGDFNYNSSSASSSGLCTGACASTLNLQGGGNFMMGSGLFTVCTGTGTAAFSFADGGIMVSGGTFNRSGTGSTLWTYTGTNGTQDLDFATGTLGTGTFALTINKTAGEVLLGDDITIGGALTLTDGTLNLAGNDVTLNGAISVTSGDIDASTGQAFTIGGTGALPGDLVFAGGGLFTSFTLNRTGATLVTSSNMDVTTLNLTAGTLTCNGTLTMADGGLISRQATATAVGSMTNAPSAGGVYDLSYTVTGGTVVLATGIEFPAAPSAVVRNVTKLGTGDLQLSTDKEVNGDLTHSAGEFLANSNDVDLAGNMVWNAASTLTGSTFTFSGSTTLSGATAPVFTNVIVSGVFTPNVNHTLNGDLTVSGTWNQGTATTTFTSAGTSTITNSGSITFNNLTISTSRTVVFPSGFVLINGNLSVTATLDGVTNAGIIAFGGSTQSFTGAGVKNFQDLAVAATSSLTCGISFSVAGTLTNDGSISFTGGTATVNGDIDNNGTISASAGTVAVNAPGVDLIGGGTTTFFDLDVNPGATFTTANDFSVADDLIADGTFTASGTVTFTGTCTMTGTGGKTFNGIALSAASSFTPNSAYTVLGDITVAGGGTYNGGNNTVTFDGTTTLSGNVNFNIAVINATRTLNCGTGTVAVASTMTNNGTLNAGSGSLTITGAFTNAGTYNAHASGGNNFGGNFVNNGTFNHNNGTITFTATGAQKQLQGNATTFYNLTINNNGSATDVLNANSNGVDLIGVLTLATDAVFDADGATNNVFTLRSSGDNPTADAHVAALSGVSAVTGNVTVERYMSLEGPASNNQIWRYISSPVNGATVADLQNELPVTGTFTGNSNGLFSPLTPGPSMFTYDETETADTDGDLVNTMDDGFETYPLAANTETLASGSGYVVFIFGDYPPLNGQTNTEWNVRAPINAGSVGLPVTFTSSGNIDNDGWNLVGNPYPSTIDWRSGSWTKTNIDPTIYMVDYSAATPVFASYNATTDVGTNGGSRYLGIGQAFWVKANAAAPALTAVEAVKSPGTSTTFFRDDGPGDLLRVSLVKGGDRDEAVIHFFEGATLGLDEELDSRKLRNPYWYLNLSSLASTGEKLSISSVPLGICDLEVPLDVSDVYNGTYTLSFTEFESLSPSMSVKLADAYLGTTTDVRTSPNYNFSVVEANPATYGSGRFKVLFEMDGTPAELVTAAPGACLPAENVGITVSGSRGDYMYSVKTTSGSTVVEPVRGSGADLQLLIPSASLQEGLNAFKVVAENRYCAAANTQGDVSFDYSALTVAPSAPPVSRCEPGAVTLTASGAPATGSYHWYATANATEVLATGDSYQIPSLSGPVSYFVSTLNSLGCESDRTEVLASVTFTDPARIELQGDTILRSNYVTGNQWFLNGSAIAGATDPYLMLGGESGLYSVEVSQEGCVSSDDFQYVVTGVEGSSAKAKLVRIFPNPVRNTLTIEVESSDPVTGELYTSSGTRVSDLQWQSEGSVHRSVLDMSSEPAGMFVVRVRRGSAVEVLRVIKR